MNSFDIVKTVRLTEKGTRQGEKLNQYTVVADRRANKVQIRQAVQELAGGIAVDEQRRKLARTAGWRLATLATSVPSPIVRVSAASAPSNVKHSSIGRSPCTIAPSK